MIEPWICNDYIVAALFHLGRKTFSFSGVSNIFLSKKSFVRENVADEDYVILHGCHYQTNVVEIIKSGIEVKLEELAFHRLPVTPYILK